MRTGEGKGKIHPGTESVERGAEAAAEKSAGRDQTCECQCHRLENELRDIGRSLLDSTKGLRQEASKQAGLHPLATFGLAFTAGLIVARALRR